MLTLQETRVTPEHLVQLAVKGTTPNTKRAYTGLLHQFLEWLDGRTITRETVKGWKEYLGHLGASPSTINLSLSAIRAMVVEMGHYGLDHGVVTSVTSVKGVPRRGTKLKTWLDKRQVRHLFTTAKVRGKHGRVKSAQRWALLALLYAGMLRRDEVANLTVDQFQQVRGTWVLANIEGKGRKTRSVPLPNWTAKAINEWLAVAEVNEGSLLRGVTRGGKVTKSMSGDAIWRKVKMLADRAGLENVTPHTLRRSGARALYNQSVPLKQISLILGHESVTTTEIYLGLDEVDLDNPALIEW